MGTAAVFQLGIRIRRLFVAARFEANDQPGDSSAAKPYDWVFFCDSFGLPVGFKPLFYPRGNDIFPVFE